MLLFMTTDTEWGLRNKVPDPDKQKGNPKTKLFQLLFSASFKTSDVWKHMKKTGCNILRSTETEIQ